MTDITIKDADGTVIASEEIESYRVGKRFSTWCANSQKKLDKMLANLPRAHSAMIGASYFDVVNGRSQASFGGRTHYD